jgi:phosphoglycolate phosphatase
MNSRQGQTTLPFIFQKSMLKIKEEIKLVIFDLDGTLINSYKAITSSFNYVMRYFGKQPKSVGDIRKAVGWGDGFLLKPFLNKEDLDLGLRIYRRHHQSSLKSQARLYPGVRELLKYLKDKGYKLAVASNRPTRFSLIILRVLKLRNYFDYVLCADKLKRGKPHPQILNLIRKRFYLKPRQVLYVGDMVIDLLAGKNAGIKTILVTTGSSSRAEIAKHTPYLSIRRVRDLHNIL